MEDYIDTAEKYIAAVPEIGAIYASIIENPLALAFCVIIAVVFGIGLLMLVSTRAFGLRRGTKAVSIIPSMLATLGVLGTFTGILLGLLDFNVDAIDDSIPRLLGGLTVAFSTSIVGMGAALIFRVLDVLLPGRRQAGKATADDLRFILEQIREENRISAASVINAMSMDGAIVSALEAGRAQTERQSVLLGEGIADLRKAVSSDADSSLVTQLQKLRSTIQDGQSDLIREFREFARHMTENTNKVLIEALQNVIRDFNDKITEQFGDNFKELNRAVGALLEWQENYKDFVERTETRVAATLEALESSERAIGSVKEHTAAIPAAMALLTPPLMTLNEQSSTLASHLDAVGGLREKALEAFPVVEENLRKITDDLGNHVTSAVTSTGEALEKQRAANEDLSSRCAELSADSSRLQKTFSTELERALGKMAEETNAAFASHSQTIEQTTAEIQRQVSEAWKRTEDSINGRMETLDNEIQQELQRTLSVMGSNLASISEKFVSDYTPLTERLRDVVQIASRVS